MRKNILVMFFILGFLMLPSLKVFAIDDLAMRPEVKLFIDELDDAEITSLRHTTKGEEVRSKRFPEEPKAFEAGRYKVVFSKANGQKAMIMQTEEKVGHLARVVPGKTEVGGFVEIQKNSEGDEIEGIGHTTDSIVSTTNEMALNPSRLNEAELDYLIQMLYKKFEKPLTDSQAVNLNKVKDYALAIKFSGKNGISEYHNNLKNKL